MVKNSHRTTRDVLFAPTHACSPPPKFKGPNRPGSRCIGNVVGDRANTNKVSSRSIKVSKRPKRKQPRKVLIKRTKQNSIKSTHLQSVGPPSPTLSPNKTNKPLNPPLQTTERTSGKRQREVYREADGVDGDLLAICEVAATSERSEPPQERRARRVRRYGGQPTKRRQHQRPGRKQPTPTPTPRFGKAPH